jgi:hypothetical protein
MKSSTCFVAAVLTLLCGTATGEGANEKGLILFVDSEDSTQGLPARSNDVFLSNDTGANVKYRVSCDEQHWTDSELVTGHNTTWSCGPNGVVISIATDTKEVRHKLEPNKRYHFDWNSDEESWDVFETPPRPEVVPSASTVCEAHSLIELGEVKWSDCNGSRDTAIPGTSIDSSVSRRKRWESFA